MRERDDARASAKAKGRKVYIGAPCRWHHRTRYVSTGNCVACRKQRTLDLDGDRAARVVERARAKLRQRAKRSRDKAEAMQPATMLELALAALFRPIPEG